MPSDPKAMLTKSRDYYSSFGEGPWQRFHVPMLAIIDWIEGQDLASEVFVSAGLSGLWISDRPHDPSGDHMLHVETHGPEFVHFEYAKKHGAMDTMKKTVKHQEAVECFRQFLAYKFGLHRKPEENEPNQPAQTRSLARPV
ncbi:MAG: hypothetical protein JNN01_06405 [Opitutaceae bacterium]|nr:hypothetical protein [Opitutaceae bacterium]